MEALIGLVARQRGFINHLFGDALAGKGGPALSAQPAAPPSLLLIEHLRMAQAEGRWSPVTRPADDLHHGVGRPAAGDRRQWSPARLAARNRPPLSQPDRQPEAARQRLVWALRGLRPHRHQKEGETA